MCATCADDGTCLSCTHPATARDGVCADSTNCLVADAFDRCTLCAAGFVLDDTLACVAIGDNCAFLIGWAVEDPDKQKQNVSFLLPTAFFRCRHLTQHKVPDSIPDSLL